MGQVVKCDLPVNVNLFWSKVNKTNRCWNWTASTNEAGYGRINIRGVVWLSHRVSFLLANGSIIKELCVMHSCDNPKCVNPNHLSQGTIADNNIDMVNKGRSAYQTGKSNNPTGLNHGRYTKPNSTARGERNGASTISDFAVLVIRKVHALGLSQKLISKAFEIHISTVNRIINNQARIS